MALPFFYKEDITETDSLIVLDEDTSKHVVQVLRMEKGEKIKLTNGKGAIFICEITDNHRKKCTVTIIDKSEIHRPKPKISIAVSPVKNNSRFEWFLEKATEIGVNEIIPLICERTEKQHLKTERLNGILISAMLQSQQAWLPVLQAAQKFAEYISSVEPGAGRLIAHCLEEEKKSLKEVAIPEKTSMLIGPEGDFSHKEIEMALRQHYIPVTLGETRLRTETAGIVAATLLCIR